MYFVGYAKYWESYYIIEMSNTFLAGILRQKQGPDETGYFECPQEQ